jgi:uncharacterized protein Yka (UPF0111/DUF47 family)
MKSRIDVVGQNGNDGLHYEYELDKTTGEVIKKYDSPINELEKMLHNTRLERYVEQIKAGSFKKSMNKLLTIPKEKPIHRMKDGAKYIMPLSQEEIIQLLKMHQWNVDDNDAVADLVDLIRAVEKVHGVL